ncbi:MAG: cytochrome P460 family protein [Bdellovibrionota bacterium]
MKRLIALAISLFAFSQALAYFELTEPGRKPREMNGIFFDKNKDFAKNWHLVTVRFREDSREQRFTYANDKAFKALQSLKPEYPDGAMFAKIGFVTEEDPSFPSSKVPSGARRFQFMLKDSKKYKTTDGWGYALFDSQGNLFDEDVKTKTQSCHACHQIVPERDFVFSRQMLLHPESVSPLVKAEEFSKVVQFETGKFKAAPEALKVHAAKFDVYNSLVGKLKDFAFSGTLDEVIPLLTDKTKKTSAPSALVVDKNNFSIVVPLADSTKCMAQNSLLSAYKVVVHFNSKLVRNAELCL